MTPIFSKLTGFALNVLTVALLGAADAGHLEDGAIGWTADVRDQWVLVKNALAGTAADGVSIIAATGAGVSAFWMRQNISDPYWAYQTTWYVDPAAGSDLVQGNAPGSALKTVAEIARRVKYAKNGNTYVVNLLGDVPVTDSFTPTYQLIGASSATNTVLTFGASFQFVGQRTVVRSGTIAAGTQQTDPTRAAATAQAEVVDAGVVSWAADVGNLIVNQDGKTAWVLTAKGGGNTARVTDWVTSAFAWVAANVPPLPGNTYDVVTLTRFRAPISLPSVQGAQTLTAPFVFDNCHLDNCQLARMTYGSGSLLFYRTCKISNEQASLAGAATNTLNFPSSTITLAKARTILTASLIQNYGTGISACSLANEGQSTSFNPGSGIIKTRIFYGVTPTPLFGVCIQAGWVQNGISSGDLTSGFGPTVGSLGGSGAWLGIYNDFDLPAGSGMTAAIQVAKLNTMSFLNSVYGVQDAATPAAGLQVRDGARVNVYSGIFEQGSGSETTTTCWNLQPSGAGTAINLDALATTLPGLNASAGAVLPAALACVTFNNYRVLFNRNMVNWNNAGGILKYA